MSRPPDIDFLGVFCALLLGLCDHSARNELKRNGWNVITAAQGQPLDEAVDAAVVTIMGEFDLVAVLQQYWPQLISDAEAGGAVLDELLDLYIYSLAAIALKLAGGINIWEYLKEPHP